MYEYILNNLVLIHSGFNVLRYITFRSFLSFVSAFVFCIIITPSFIKYIRSKQFVQTIREDGPKTHQIKKNTPTMGGVIILISIILASILWAKLNLYIIWCIFCVIYLGILGFIDDYLKVIKKHHRGVSARAKIIFQLFFSILLCLYLFFSPVNTNFAYHLHIPYFKEAFIDLGFIYYLIVILTFIGASNGVNLTDGLDGLAIGNLIFVGITYAVLSYLAGNFKLASYLKIIYVPHAGELTVFLSSLIGASLGFLWFNSYPANIFMGDTGSLFLGGVIGLISIFIKQELLLVVAGGIFVVEALSVILQVLFYKKTKKRIFLMAPLHHHFELKGFHEAKITVRFWIISIILSIIALASLKIR